LGCGIKKRGGDEGEKEEDWMCVVEAVVECGGRRSQWSFFFLVAARTGTFFGKKNWLQFAPVVIESV
jgi:hypothetical protein